MAHESRRASPGGRASSSSAQRRGGDADAELGDVALEEGPGGGAAEVHALRERLAGPEAAARLAQLDEHRAAWSGRVAAFRAARARLAEDTSLAPEERTAAVDRLLAESFTPAERLRVQALDRLATTP